MPQTQIPILPEEVAIKPTRRAKHRRSRSRFRAVRRARRRFARINWRMVVVVVGAVIGVLVLAGFVLTADATNQVQASWLSLNRVLDALNSRPSAELTLADFERLQGSVTEVNNSLAAARWQTGFLRPFSFLSADLKATFSTLDAAHDLALAANDMLTGLEPTLVYLAEGDATQVVTAQVSSGQRIVDLLELGAGRFTSARDHLMAARDHIDHIDLTIISVDSMLTVLDLDRYHQQLANANAVLIEVPDLLIQALGLADAQNYLILSQNSDELRPSGGYISTFGWLQVRNAQVVDYDYNPTTVTSPNPPDQALASEVNVPNWWIRYQEPIYAAWDGSWYADFPETAAMAVWFYDNGGNPQSPVQGVIAIDTVGFEYLLETLGEVTVPGYDEIVTIETFREAVYRIRGGLRADTDDQPHKRFLAALYRQILNDWQNSGQEHGNDLLMALLRGLQEKHIMFYFTDPYLNAIVERIGWSGAQQIEAGYDYLMVADANLSNKSNRSISRSLTYDVAILPGGDLQSRLMVSYDYPALVADADPALQHYWDINYQNLLQVFVPAQSALLETQNLSSTPRVVPLDQGTSIASLTQVDYNSSANFQFSYTVPPVIERFGPYRRYRLLIQKQPGMRDEVVNVQITLPQNARPLNIWPEPLASYNLETLILEFRLNLRSDQWIEVVYME